MSNEWIKAVNQIVGIERIGSILDFLEQDSSPDMSPIDNFYTSMREILCMATSDFLNEHKAIGAFMLVQLVSTTENYLRDILSRLLQVCPVSKGKSSGRSISLGSVMWHGVHNVERGAFENMSFSETKNINKACSDFLGYSLKDINKGGQTTAVIEEFDKICELRHGIVHSNCILAGKNAVKLGIDKATNLTRIKIEYPQFQQCAAICNTLAISFNMELFEEMARRWALVWSRDFNFSTQQQNELFKMIWSIFYSKMDSDADAIESPMSLIKCRNRIKIFYHIQ